MYAVPHTDVIQLLQPPAPNCLTPRDMIILCLEQLPLFSVVHFPNEECTSSSSNTTIGTCFTSSECTSKSGIPSGGCAAGFGVCCVISTSTCSSEVSSNITYIRNPGYPSSITPTTTGTCSFTINKVSDDVCQLRKVLKIIQEESSLNLEFSIIFFPSFVLNYFLTFP